MAGNDWNGLKMLEDPHTMAVSGSKWVEMTGKSWNRMEVA